MHVRSLLDGTFKVDDRYPGRVFSQDWNAKPHKGKQRNIWSRLGDRCR